MALVELNVLWQTKVHPPEGFHNRELLFDGRRSAAGLLMLSGGIIPRTKAICMRIPGGLLLGCPDGSLHTLKPALLWAREMLGRAPGPAGLASCLCPPSWALLHHGMLARHSRQAMQLFSRGDWQRQGGRRSEPRSWRECRRRATWVPCRYRCNVPVGANLCGLPHALALCYGHRSGMESSEKNVNMHVTSHGALPLVLPKQYLIQRTSGAIRGCRPDDTPCDGC